MGSKVYSKQAGKSAQGWGHASWSKRSMRRGTPTGVALLPHFRAHLQPIQCCWRVSHWCLHL